MTSDSKDSLDHRTDEEDLHYNYVASLFTECFAKEPLNQFPDEDGKNLCPMPINL
uniref:Uncharacterized protein n=1 Tax=Rhizophora mucronata TaxID=61149 RepID=A0A2P2J2T5_RHIMU